LSLLGSPLRLGALPSGVAVAYSTDAVEAYIAESATLGDDQRFADVADALDAAGSFGAFIVERDFSVEALRGSIGDDFADVLAESVSDTGAFDIVGIGMVDRTGDAGNVVAYHFDSDDEADRSADELEALWRDGERFTSDGPLSDYFDVLSVEVDGSLVIVSLQLRRAQTTLPAEMLFDNEVVFLHG
jgi:hypothetical protein